MFKHNLVLFYRNFKRHKTTFLINVAGLSCGLACVLLIYLWVSDELSFDRYHAKDSRLYQVMANNKTETGIETNGNTPHILSEVLASEMPEVENIVTATGDHFLPAFTLMTNKKNTQATGKFAGKDFFKIFSYQLVLGNESNVLSDKSSMVLSQSQAERLFGSTDNAIGIAMPLSYLVAKNWLDSFAYHVNLEWWYFIGAGAVTICIALGTVSFQSVKAALVNPAKSLRAE